MARETLRFGFGFRAFATMPQSKQSGEPLEWRSRLGLNQVLLHLSGTNKCPFWALNIHSTGLRLVSHCMVSQGLGPSSWCDAFAARRHLRAGREVVCAAGPAQEPHGGQGFGRNLEKGSKLPRKCRGGWLTPPSSICGKDYM